MELSPSGGAVDLTPSALVATHEFTLPDTGKVTYTLTITATDSLGQPAPPVVRTLTVDLEAPTVTLVTPAASTVYTSTDLPVRVDVGGDDVSTVRILVQVGTDPPPRRWWAICPCRPAWRRARSTSPWASGRSSPQATDPAGNAASTSAAGVDVRRPAATSPSPRPSIRGGDAAGWG